MAVENTQSQGPLDPDRTDKLPILEGIEIAADVADDAVRLDAPPLRPAPEPGPAREARADFARAQTLDLPALAQSVRSVEERIARQSADYETLSRLYEKSRDAESAATERVETLTAALTKAQSALAVEQHRLREMEALLADKSVLAESARVRAEHAMRDIERQENEMSSLKNALAAREATIVQVLHSLGERDAQLHALQREHAQTVPALEARSQASAQLELELQAARSHTESIAAQLREREQAVAALTAQMQSAQSELAAARREFRALKAQADTYLEHLRSREWRRGFDQNLLREWDAKVDAVRAGLGTLQGERDRLKQTSAVLSAKLIEQEETIQLKGHELEESRRAQADSAARIGSLEAACRRLEGELAAREEAERAGRAAEASEAQRARELLAAAELRLAEQDAQLSLLRAEAETREEEMTVLLAHLNEARRPVQTHVADAKRLGEELMLKNAALEQLTEENRTLRTTLERTRGALEEREFLIRRLERSESHNANALGRLQTSIEKLGTASPTASVPAIEAAECTAALIRIDGAEQSVYRLARRNRIGRAQGCELHIDSTSVSRHHALIIKGQRELIIEDLNSTNGVVVNGRKISRYALSDGDLVTIGDVRFRVSLTLPAQPPPEPRPGGPPPGEPGKA